jgi:hypothetical protein
MRKITVLKVEPKKEPYTVDIEGNDSWDLFCNMRNEIDAELAQILTLRVAEGRCIVLFLDDEGKLTGKEYCRKLFADYIAGTFLVVAFNEHFGEYTSLSEEEIKEQTGHWKL